MDNDIDDQELEKIKQWSSFELDDAFERDKKNDERKAPSTRNRN